VQDITALETLFEDVRDSVSKLDRRVCGIEHRVTILSTNISKEQDELNSLRNVRVQLDFVQFSIILVLMVIATAIVVYFLATQFGG
jgi:hypothetical protein